MYIKFLIFTLCIYPVLCCDPRCSCFSSSVNCTGNSWTFETIPFDIPSTITTLIMDNQLLRNLSSLNCSRYPNLRYLYVRNNLLNTLDDNDILGCTSLHSMYLDGNMISDLGFLLGVSTSLYSLSLNNNSLSEIKNTTFSGMTSLAHIYLGSNEIHTIEEESFAPMLFETLTLDGNLITTIHNRTFVGIGYFVINNVHINLANNRLTTIEEAAFHGTGIYSLDLRGNRLTDLNKRMFEGMPYLYFVNLSGNKIRHVSSELFKSFGRHDYNVDLNDNPVSCGTQTRPRPFHNMSFAEWIDTGFDVKDPREACLVTPSRQVGEVGNKESIEVHLFVYCDEYKLQVHPIRFCADEV